MNLLLSTETRPLGQMLRERGLISEDDLKNALALQQERRDKLGRILVDLGYVAERDVLNVVSEQLINMRELWVEGSKYQSDKVSEQGS